ncbi:MAG TPA: hypothetical protein VKP30_18830 [Polyangiaceae bacterium]|nr:hypothetical protein [Polyangiaceae bacterium]
MSTRAVSCILCWCVAVLTGCGTDIAQTAEYRGRPGFECTPATENAVLPEAEPWLGTRSAAQFPLVSSTYDRGEGPGIVVVSRDAFRLYVNDELLIESEQAFQPIFVGYTFLPGRNLISIVAAGADRPPRVAVRIDELERMHVSNGDWLVSVAPAPGWRTAAFDDSGWTAAVDYGDPTSQANCGDLGAVFSSSQARWIGAPDPSNTLMALRYRLDILPDGFGEKTTGGEVSNVTVVTDVASLRAAVEGDPTPRVVVIPEGTLDGRLGDAAAKSQLACPTACDNSSVTQYVVLPPAANCSVEQVAMKRYEDRIKVAANKTLMGLGRGAHLRGMWFDLSNSSNLILRNLSFFDINPHLIEAGDGLSFNRTSRAWIDHCTFKWISDGFTDVYDSSTGVTVSWSRFDGENDLECHARHLRASEIIDSEATFHHCWWQHVEGRAPFAHGSNARVHLYNNVVTDALDYAVASGCEAQVLLEASYFEDVQFPTSRRDCTETPGQLGFIQAAGRANLYGSRMQSHLRADTAAEEPADPVFEPPYPYDTEPANEVRFKVYERAGAGSQWALPLRLD